MISTFVDNTKIKTSSEVIKEKYAQTVYLIKKVYNLNSSIPKGYGTRSSDYAYWYSQKSAILSKIEQNIREYGLNIKYGNNDEVAYFCFEGQQYSFHRYYCKKNYSGEWIGTRRSKKEKRNNNSIIGKKCLYK